MYCVPILQSLAQLKTLFADGAWEGIVGNCDTFIYLGGNEASTYEYVSKLLGKWTIDKRTSGESKGSSGSYTVSYTHLKGISLALQGYNFGSGYIDWALKNYGCYSKENAEIFSKKMCVEPVSYTHLLIHT